MTVPLRHVADRLFNRPLCLSPSAAETISAFLLTRMSNIRAGLAGDVIDRDAGEARTAFQPTERAGSIEVYSPRASRFYGEFYKDESNRPLPYRRTPDGTAIMTLIGEWVNRGAWVGASSGLISYEGFSFQMRRAAADRETRSILLDLESPGGEGIGAFEASAVVREVAKIKPVVALVNGMAASAAYAIASGATRIVSIPSGLAGSIGVVLLHLDISKWLDDEGVKPTLIFAGDHKVDGNPFGPLPKEVRKEMQEQVAGFYDQFVETVAAGRGMSAAAVCDTQARIFKGEDAVAAGLVDAIGDFETVLNEMPALAGTRNKGALMGPPSEEPNDGSRAEDRGSVDVAKIAADAWMAAQARCAAILTAKEAEGRRELAHHLALKTQMPAEEALALLSVAPREQIGFSRGHNWLDGRVPQPNVTAWASGETNAADGWDAAVEQVNAEGKKISGVH